MRSISRIAVDEFDFVLERQVVLAGALDRGSQQRAELRDRLDGRGVALLAHERAHRVETVEKEVRMQLPAQRGEFRLRELGFELGGPQPELQRFLRALPVLEIVIDRQRGGEEPAESEKVHRQRDDAARPIRVPVDREVALVRQPEVRDDPKQEPHVDHADVDQQAADEDARQVARKLAAGERKLAHQREHDRRGDQPDEPRRGVPRHEHVLQLLAMNPAMQALFEEIADPQQRGPRDKDSDLQTQAEQPTPGIELLPHHRGESRELHAWARQIAP